MKKSASITLLGVLAAGSIGLAATAAAVPLTGGPADATVRALESEGYVVLVDQSTSVALSQCIVLGVNGLRGTEDNGVLRDPSKFNVATLDLNCPNSS